MKHNLSYAWGVLRTPDPLPPYTPIWGALWGARWGLNEGGDIMSLTPDFRLCVICFLESPCADQTGKVGNVGKVGKAGKV